MHMFWKKVPENLSCLSFNEFKLATNKTSIVTRPEEAGEDCCGCHVVPQDQ